MTRDGSSDVPIAAVGDSVFFGAETTDGDAIVVLAAATGNERWRRSTEIPLGPGILTAAGHLLTRQYGGDSAIKALDAHTGEPGWQRPTGSTRYAAFDGRRIVVGTENHLIGLAPHTGTERWRGDEPDSLQWGPAIGTEYSPGRQAASSQLTTPPPATDCGGVTSRPR